VFDVSLSSVKRYARKARQRDSLAPKKGSGRPPKLDGNAGRLLEEDIMERPAATVEQRRSFLEHLTGMTLSNSTVRRLLKRLGFSRKKGLWRRWSETSFGGRLGE
jgi:transposase